MKLGAAPPWLGWLFFFVGHGENYLHVKLKCCADMIENFDWDMNVDNLFSYNVLIFENANPDIQVLNVSHNTHLASLIQEHFGDEPIQTIVNNMSECSRKRCSYFRIVMTDVGDGISTNFKLKNFYQQIGMTSLSSRCRKAMAIGLHSLQYLDSPISIPMAFCTTTIDPLDFQFDGTVDLACLSPCGNQRADLCDIAGLSIPYFVPWDIQWKIVSYLESPLALLIKEDMGKMYEQWDIPVCAMFVQREPRIPAHIARYYNAATVQSAIGSATKSRLAPTAGGWDTAVGR